MEIYELCAANPPKTEPSYYHDISLLDTDERAVLRLPRIYCPTCRRSRGGGADPVPEAARLPSGHPMLRELRAVRDLYEAEKKAVGDEFRHLVPDLGHPQISRDHPIWRRREMAGTDTPSQFAERAERLRRALNLPADRFIRPYDRVGELSVICNMVRLPDFILNPLDAVPIVVRVNVAVALRAAGCTGFDVYPVHITRLARKTRAAVPELCEILVTGRAKAPGPGSDPWRLELCPECRLPNRATRWPDRITLESSEWDGTDIFHFDHWDKVFVTERFRDAVRGARFRGAGFRAARLQD